MSEKPSESEMFALRSVMRHFEYMKFVKRKEFHEQTDLEKSQVTSFLNRPQGDRANQTQYSALVPFTAMVYETHQREIKDPVVLDAVRTAIRHPHLGAVAQQENYEVENDLISWIRVDGTRIVDATKMLSGMWLITRLSSAMPSKTDVPEFNVSLVNIDPHQIVEDLRLPRFKHYVNGKNREPSQAEVFEGFVMVDDRNVYLLGRKRLSTSLQPEMFSFHYVPAENSGSSEEISKLPSFQGHANSVSSTRGQIGVYYLAEFIEGSHQLSKDEFEAKKKEYVDKIGVFTLEQLKESGLLNKLDRLPLLVERSRDHTILFND